MKEHLRALVGAAANLLQGRNVLREYLQARILGALQRCGAMLGLALQGGTALRFLFSIPRFSEDLDFALERPDAGYDLRRYLQATRSELEAEGYAVELRVSDRKPVHAAFVCVPGLLHALGLSPRRGETLSVKLEVDTRPPAGAVLATTVVRRHLMLQLQHLDRASLLAGKLHCILQRPYLKGRDIYDLVWYLSDRSWPEPNLGLLAAALAQTGWSAPCPTARSWRRVIRDRLDSADWSGVVADVGPFLERDADRHLLTREAVRSVLVRRP